MARIVEGDAGKIICKEAVRLKPAAVVMGTRGRGLVQRFFFFYFFASLLLPLIFSTCVLMSIFFLQFSSG